MSGPQGLEALALRIGALETDYFLLAARVRKFAEMSERTANNLDDLEEVLDEVSMSAAEQADAMAEAMAQREAHLHEHPDTEAPPIPTPTPQDPSPSSAPKTAGAAGADEQPAFPEVEQLHAWVGDHIAPLVRKITTTGEGGGIRWCQSWWEHVDAVERFMALYLVFHELSEEESGSWLSVYLRDHLDPHLATLTSPQGPFYACSPHRHSDTGTELGQQQYSGGTDD